MSIDQGISFGLYKAFQGSHNAAGCKTVMFIHYIMFCGKKQISSIYNILFAITIMQPQKNCFHHCIYMQVFRQLKSVF